MHHFTFAILVSPFPEHPGQRADVCVIFAGANVAAGARTHGVNVVQHWGAEGDVVYLRGQVHGVRFVRGAAEGEAGKPFKTCQKKR